MQLLPWEAGITQAEETILFDAHDGGDVFGHDELVDANDSFKSKLRHIIYYIGCGASGIKAGYAEVVVRQADGYGDGTGTAYDVANGFRTVQCAYSARYLFDGDG